MKRWYAIFALTAMSAPAWAQQAGTRPAVPQPGVVVPAPGQVNTFDPNNPSFRQLLQPTPVTGGSAFGSGFQQLAPGFGFVPNGTNPGFFGVTPNFNGLNSGSVGFTPAFNGVNSGFVGVNPFMDGTTGFNGASPLFTGFNPGLGAFSPFFGGVSTYTPNTTPIAPSVPSAAGTVAATPVVGLNTSPAAVAKPAGVVVHTRNARTLLAQRAAMAQRLQSMMSRYPFINGTVLKVNGDGTLMVRTQPRGSTDAVNRTYRAANVFFFNGDDAFDAASAPDLIHVNMPVLVPDIPSVAT